MVTKLRYQKRHTENSSGTNEIILVELWNIVQQNLFYQKDFKMTKKLGPKSSERKFVWFCGTKDMDVVFQEWNEIKKFRV